MMILVITGTVTQMTTMTPTMKIPTTPITELGTPTIPNTEFRTIWQTQSLRWLETFNIKETALERKSETLTPLMEQIQPSSAHSSSNYNSASTIDLAHSLKITEKSTSPSLISRVLRLPTSRIPLSSRT